MEWTTKMEGGGSLYLRDDGHYLYLEANRPQEPGIYKVILQGMGGGQVLGTMEPKENGLKLCRMVSRSTISQWGCLPLTKVICQRSYPPPPLEERPLMGEDVLSSALLEENQPSMAEKNHIPPEEEIDFYEPELDAGQGEISQEVETAEIEALSSTKEPIIWTEVPEHPDFFPCSRPEKGISVASLAEGIRGWPGVLRQERADGFALAVPYFADKAFPLTPLFCLAKWEVLLGRDYLIFGFSQEGRPLGLQ